MENYNLFKKALGFAQKGNGRRLLNTLNKKDTGLTTSEVEEILKTYRETGLTKEVEILKERRGILKDGRYNTLADEVRENCCAERYDAFAISLKNLLSSGMTMNPIKTDMEDLL